MSAVHVASEIGPLRTVLVHPPGTELRAVTPDTRREYLYDDIIDIARARREHEQLRQVLTRFATVHEVRDLLRELLERADVREYLIARMMDVGPSEALAREFAGRQSDELVRMLVEGSEEEGGPIARALNAVGYSLPPAPNLFFTRDIGIVIGEHVVIGAMRHGARWSEELLIKALFAFHPALAGGGILYDGSEERRLTYTIEGGDVHPARPDLVLLGHSSRTSAAALDHLVETLFQRTPVTDVLVVVMPGERSAIHLDMIFTQVDRDLCVVYPPHFMGPGRLGVLHCHKGSASVREMPDFFSALRAVDLPLEPVRCGGTHRTVEEREQWASGCNIFAVRPGVGLAYGRNEATLRELEQHGFRLIPADEFLALPAGLPPDQRAMITLDCAELVRGGGGPRCMTLPLRRDDL